ncbi:hypothetical protein Afil01_64070 [Actinorhabdospora filicis]|uniref:Uncharacterized protein n=1 Tax=Actinorhabdospora filicis TaxID=1785913 RepID=A0A9W6STD0_9ACTN|nr:hypothetical protein [Actinorhabdospora filicis]GLZ81600.1 hypothetical protein Afil01_64070 [Actinorhabdospora filicis]
MMWVGGRRVRAGDPLTEARAAAFVADDVVRDFADWAEVTAYIDRATDYIGTLPGPNCAGAWIWFEHDAHMNVIGEDHSYIEFNELGAAVRARSFTYEPFSTDVLAPGSELARVYLDENRQRMNALGIAAAPDHRRYGGESLYPKIADTTADLIPYFTGVKDMAQQRPPNWDGIPNQRYLRMAWAHAHDIAAAGAASPEETVLVHEYNTHRNLLGGWINGLTFRGYLGVSIDGHRDFYAPLRDFCAAYCDLMLQRAFTDPGIQPAERLELQGLPRTSPQKMLKIFNRWRNFYMAGVVAQASANNVRYAAMGSYHMNWLRRKGRMPAAVHMYDVGPLGHADVALAYSDALRVTR